MSANPNLSGNGVPPRMPNWVKVFIIILIALVVIVVIAHLMGFRVDHAAEGVLLSSLASLAENTVLPQ